MFYLSYKSDSYDIYEKHGYFDIIIGYVVTKGIKMTAVTSLFKTADLALAPFLTINGLIYIATELNPDNESEILFVFEDKDGRGRDLSMLFHRSDEKLYHSYWAFYRNQLALAKKQKSK